MQPPQPFHDDRPWGKELWFKGNAPTMVKILTINPGEEFSLQYHHKRDESWYVISGNGSAQVDSEIIELNPGSYQFVPRMIKHRLKSGNLPLAVLELTYGEFDEKDEVRLEDHYGRT
ncbi:MAG: phosphomannose isomerase type II C-terminal cupin domain [Candidatus Taylorbacteria bacterium]|nr:phosphomannose isomerase type II C-terminal cupin domain [Candidatus Taylorbacteria bacterium]